MWLCSTTLACSHQLVRIFNISHILKWKHEFLIILYLYSSVYDLLSDDYYKEFP